MLNYAYFLAHREVSSLLLTQEKAKWCKIGVRPTPPTRKTTPNKGDISRYEIRYRSFTWFYVSHYFSINTHTTRKIGSFLLLLKHEILCLAMYPNAKLA